MVRICLSNKFRKNLSPIIYTRWQGAIHQQLFNHKEQCLVKNELYNPPNSRQASILANTYRFSWQVFKTLIFFQESVSVFLFNVDLLEIDEAILKNLIIKDESKMIKLILTDMDGTFLNSKGDYNRELFEKVKKKMNEQGVAFAPVTGKQCERVEELFGDDAKDFWILGDSATRIKHNGEYVYESLLNNALGLEIIQLLEEIDREQTIIACTRNGAYVRNDIPIEEYAIVRGSYAVVKHVANFNEIKEDFIKITVHDPKHQCFETKEKLSRFFDVAYIVASEAAWIDISNAGVHKGSTVENLQKMLGVTPEETMAFGDGYNDKELLSRASYSFAVRNAVQEIKDLANYITRSNDEDAVMKTILQMLTLQQNTCCKN